MACGPVMRHRPIFIVRDQLLLAFPFYPGTKVPSGGGNYHGQVKTIADKCLQPHSSSLVHPPWEGNLGMPNFKACQPLLQSTVKLTSIYILFCCLVPCNAYIFI